MSYAVENFNNTTITNNEIRWNSNGRCLPKDCVEDLVAAGLVTRNQQIITDAAREVETAQFFAEYREAQANRSAEQIREERAMARGAMGAGVAMVNIITGERYTT
jgi:hypothetical protein